MRSKEKDELIQMAANLCYKFIKKVETGRADSVETYVDCKEFISYLHIYQEKENTNENIPKV